MDIRPTAPAPPAGSRPRRRRSWLGSPPASGAPTAVRPRLHRPSLAKPVVSSSTAPPAPTPGSNLGLPNPQTRESAAISDFRQQFLKSIMGRKVVPIPEFAPRKCATRNFPSEDRISLLPDEILVCISSFLTVKEAAKTSVLSKRWLHVWTYVTRLDFDASAALQKIAPLTLYRGGKFWDALAKERCEYIKWVNKVLQSHKALVLDEFRVFCDFNCSSQEEIDKWLQYAFTRKVQRLELNLVEHGLGRWSKHNDYTLNCGSLGLMSWEALEEHHLVDFKSLKALSLNRVSVSGEVLEFFLHNCKFLERLVVCGSQELKSLEVSDPSHSLQHLEIYLCLKLESLIVRDVNILSLKIQYPEKVVLENVPMLVDFFVFGHSDIVKDIIYRHSCILLKLKVLTLFLLPHQAEELEAKLVEIPLLTELKQLIVLVGASIKDQKAESFLGLTSLITASPNLEKFAMKFEWDNKTVRIHRKLNYRRCLHLHLKVVELYGYYGRACEVELVKYFLENAVSLQKIRIDSRRYWINDLPWFSNRQKRPQEIEMEQDGRKSAKEQLEELIPSHVELTIV